MGNLGGKTALVTGGGRGIGIGIVMQLAKDGADIALTYNASRAGAEKVAEEVQAIGRRCVAIQADAAEASSGRRIVDECIAKLGRLDILVNNAAVANVGLLQDLSEDQIQQMLDINIRAVVLTCRAALEHLPKGGRIVMIGSALADRVFAGGLAPYAMTKAALAGFTRGLAREVGPRGINVNIVHPGNTYSDMNPPGSPQEDSLRALTALDRYNVAEDIASAVSYLVSIEARNITGTALTVDGGMNA